MPAIGSDAEGPLSKNDNAMEVAVEYIPEGGKIFAIVSKYDDFLADVVKKPGYKAGDTLKLILPFLRAHDVTNKKIEEYSKKNILLVPGAEKTIEHINGMEIPFYLISTSYEPYVRALCEVTGFNFDNAYCTALDIEKHPKPGPFEVKYLMELAKEISQMKMPEWPDNAKSIDDLSGMDQETIHRLDKIFWEIMPNQSLGQLIENVNPIGGFEKAEALKECSYRSGVHLEESVYIGDSITDVQAFELIAKHGGLPVSFNGNGYAVRAAGIASMSKNTYPSTVIAETFVKKGKGGVLELASKWHDVVSRKSLGDYDVPLDVAKDLYGTYRYEEGEKGKYRGHYPRVVLLDDNNRESVTEESEAYRKTVRGEQIGALG